VMANSLKKIWISQMAAALQARTHDAPTIQPNRKALSP
jgi:hypothetical protein